MKSAILLSGGVDSFCLWRLCEYSDPIYFRLGHRYQFSEEQTLQAIDAAWKMYTGAPMGIVYRDTLSLGSLEQDDAFIPLRNLLLYAMLVAEGYDQVYLGGLRGELSRDKSRKFYRQTQSLLSFLEGRPVRIEAPGRFFTKAGLVAEYLQEFPAPEDQFLLTQTRSCYTLAQRQPDIVGCGTCQACFRRWVGMSLNGIYERYCYPPWLWAAQERRDWKRGLRLLRTAPLFEWISILLNNLEAQRALQRVSAS